ncbi:Acid phosphatase [Pseudocercospora fuligena]|uniref:Purple acid phosphatase n=1 Tax=Pseudocercospora fuligena TaxID=685502 RepID=A0A8H6RLM3_9PEZI|nr:Acid phosphatase [Pseudocercospora fuligena]
MKTTTASAFLAALLVTAEAAPAEIDARDVDTRFPYTGPAIPVGDWVDSTIKGNGKGFPRLVEPPAVKPKSSKPTNNVNVIQLSYAGDGINIHYQTPFGLGVPPSVHWGTSSKSLSKVAYGATDTYDRTPPCSMVAVTLCSQYFHNVQIKNLKPDTTYYYLIPAANGTTASQVMSFKTARTVGDKRPFTMAVLNDMGYTNAHGTHKQLVDAVKDGIAFAWHGGDISYADDWYSGILPCEDSWPLCYNGTSTELPGTPPAPFPSEYAAPLPKGEIPNQGGPHGGDMNVIYESNWDLWQQWQNAVTTKVPYMVLPGNHEAACAEFDGPGNILTAYLNDDKSNSTAPKSNLTYYSCPPSQRNFTTFQHRFRMPGEESGGVGNFWYSFDYGMAHFIALDGETDFAYSPEWPFVRDIKGDETLPTESETFVTDSGPFGKIDNKDWKNNEAYEQYQWLKKDLAKIDRTKTPWVIAMSHRPMYSSEVSSYQKNIRNAWQSLLIDAGVDAYMAGHIHWYERMWPITMNGTVDSMSIKNNHTYMTNPGVSMTHLTNGMAGNIESHSTLGNGTVLNTTAVLNQADYGFNKLTFKSATELHFQFIKGDGSGVGDELTLIKKAGGQASHYGHRS